MGIVSTVHLVHFNNKRQRITKGQSIIDITEKLATSGTQDEEKQNKNTTQHNMYWTPLYTNKHV